MGRTMHTKLTLRISAPLIKAAKKYSKNHGKSVSQLVADYLLLLTKKNIIKPQSGHAVTLTKSLKGILKKRKVTEKSYKDYLENKF